MSGPRDCADVRAMLGPLLLGRLTPDEERAVRAHIDACRGCRHEIDELAPVVDLLDRVDADAVDLAADDLHRVPAGGRAVADPAAPPAHLREAVLAALAAESRGARRRTSTRRRLTVALPVAVAAALVAVFAVVGVPGLGGHAGTQSLALRAVNGSGTSGTVQVTPKDGRLVVEVRASGMRPGARYGFWLEQAGKKRVSLWRWQVDATTCEFVVRVPGTLRDVQAFGFSTVDDHRVVAQADI